MLIEADFKQLEILCAAYLSRDEVLIGELRNGVDIHGGNQQTLGLPSRLVAKVFVFRLIYGGSAYAYANDPEFAVVSTSVKYWEDVIEKFYKKYSGLHKWHINIVKEVIRHGKLPIPTGRVYTFERDTNGNWPRTTILNYPVQGFGADLMAIARVSLYRRLRAYRNLHAKLISTVHDSILIDLPSKEVPVVCELIQGVWKDLPRNFEKVFGKELDLQTHCEIKYGPTWGMMNEYKAKEYILQQALA